MTDIMVKPSLLVVDDELNILKSMRRLFRQAGYDVHTANSGHEAQLILAGTHVDVVLSDFRMPEMNGGELLSFVKQTYPDITCLIISGYTDFDSVLSVLNEGVAYKFLTKPWDNTQLIEEVAAAFQHNATQKQQNNRLENSDELHSKQEMLSAVDALQYEKHAFTIAYVTIDNAFDLQDANVNTSEILPQIASAVELQAPSCQIFNMHNHAMILLLPIQDENEARHFIAHVLHSELNASWLKAEAASIDLAVSFICSLDFTVSTHNLYETLQEASALLNNQDQFVSLNNQYLVAKKRRLTIKSDVHKALKMNQFSLAFQPKVKLEDGIVESAEILLRWRHQDLGWVSPAEFIDIAEADGQIHDIGDWVIEHGIKSIARLSRVCHEFKRLSINVSANQLMNLKIVNTIKNTLEKYQVDAKHLIIEVTETSLIKNLAVTSKTLHALKSLGLKIAIDDFGVGYSSFAYLSKLPVDILKIDRAMLDDIEYNQDTQMLVENLVKTCHSMNIDVVAEGIETQEALEKVDVANCDYVQGYFYSAAVNDQDIEKMFIMQPYRKKKKLSTAKESTA